MFDTKGERVQKKHIKKVLRPLRVQVFWGTFFTSSMMRLSRSFLKARNLKRVTPGGMITQTKSTGTTVERKRVAHRNHRATLANQVLLELLLLLV